MNLTKCIFLRNPQSCLNTMIIYFTVFDLQPSGIDQKYLKSLSKKNCIEVKL